MSQGLKDRTKKFAIDVACLCADIPNAQETNNARGQLQRCSSSVAANYRAACRGKSKADFIAKLVDVYPDGRAFNVQEGALRLRYREGLSKNVWMKKGEVYEARLDLHATANYFGPGHRIRLEVTSSSFPRFDRNLNTGGNNYDETEWVTAENVVHHSRKHPSHLLLPVIE